MTFACGKLAAIQGIGVVPPFGEDVQKVAYHRTVQFECGIVPRRSAAVAGIHGQRLWISGVLGVVPAAVTEVDAADERDVLRRTIAVPDDEQLLVMRPEYPDSLIQQYLSPGIVDLTPEQLVGSAADRRGHALPMRPPHQAAHLDAPASQRRQQVADRRPVRY